MRFQRFSSRDAMKNPRQTIPKFSRDWTSRSTDTIHVSRWLITSGGSVEMESWFCWKYGTWKGAFGQKHDWRSICGWGWILTVLFWSCIDNGPCAIFSFEKCFRRSDKSASSGSAADLKRRDKIISIDWNKSSSLWNVRRIQRTFAFRSI